MVDYYSISKETSKAILSMWHKRDKSKDDKDNILRLSNSWNVPEIDIKKLIDNETKPK